MKKPQFFLSANMKVNDRVSLSESDAHHIFNVLRKKTGEEIILSDGRGKSFVARLEKVDRAGVSCLITQLQNETTSAFPRITLVQGLPKGDKMDLIVQKGTELGLFGIIPLLSQRVIVKLTEEKLIKRQERWQRIAMEAARQCRRPDVPVISKPASWSQVLEGLPQQAMALIPWEDEGEMSLKRFLGEHASPVETFFFIGPEGGFSSSEVEGAVRYGVRPVGLGPRILRTETAGLAVAAMLLYQWGDLGGV